MEKQFKTTKEERIIIDKLDLDKIDLYINNEEIWKVFRDVIKVTKEIDKEQIKEIFKEIESAIERTRSPVPVPIEQSKLIIELKKIKEKYGYI